MVHLSELLVEIVELSEGEFGWLSSDGAKNEAQKRGETTSSQKILSDEVMVEQLDSYVVQQVYYKEGIIVDFSFHLLYLSREVPSGIESLFYDGRPFF